MTNEQIFLEEYGITGVKAVYSANGLYYWQYEDDERFHTIIGIDEIIGTEDEIRKKLFEFN